MSEARSFEHPAEIECPGGPILIRGRRWVTDSEGEVHLTCRPVSAVCRCGHSAQPPWCDGTHKVLPRPAAPE